MSEVLNSLPSSSGVSSAYADVALFNTAGKLVGIDVDTDVGFIRQTYLTDAEGGRAAPGLVSAAAMGTVHHPDSAFTGARSNYFYVLRSDGHYERAWYRDHTCLMASKGNTAAIEVCNRLFAK